MKVLLISVNKEKSYRPALPIGMVTVAAQARAAGHAVDCLDLCFAADDEAEVRGAIDRASPQVIGISIRNVDSQNFLEPIFYPPFVLQVVEWCRQAAPRAVIVLGGAGFSHLPEEMMRYTGAEYGIASFGESSFPLLLERLEHGSSVEDVPGICYWREDGSLGRREPAYKVDFARVTTPAREFYDRRYFSYGRESGDLAQQCAETVQTKKGCVLSCIFCSNFQVDGEGVALKPPAQAVDEIERILARGETTGFEFVDGVFNLPLAHALAVCREMKRRGIRAPWTCMLNPAAVSVELADLLQETGCERIEFGTDSLSDPVLRVLKKNFRQEHVRNADALLTGRGIDITHCVFLGSPGETRESLAETLDVLSELVPATGVVGKHAYLSLGLRVFAGTRLHEIARAEGVVPEGANLAVPRFYVAPWLLEDEALLDAIEARVVANENWYLWWGIPNVPLRKRVRQVVEETRKIEALFLEALARPREREEAAWTH
jgi:radical SAM superfamily enzyme YgiQ (UPF0313 family)